MTAPAREILLAFDALRPAEKQEVAVEILRRSHTQADLSEEALDELGAELFRSYDAEEAAGAQG